MIYRQLDKKLFRDDYVFVDTERLMLEDIFRENGLKVHIKKRFVHEPTGYFITICSTRKNCEEAFDRSMAELRRKLLITGKKDAETFFEKLFAFIDDAITADAA